MFVGIVFQRVHGIEPQSIKAVITHPHQGILDQELADKLTLIAFEINGGPQPVLW
jgi:hypothetical protein